MSAGRGTLCAAIRGVAGRRVSMDRVIEIAALGIGGFGGVALAVWWLDRLMRRTLAAFNEYAREHEKTLAVVSAELQFARSEVSRLQTEVTVMRFAVESLLRHQASIGA